MGEGAPAPVVVLVRPQLGENIGMAARAMGNFGLARLRLVAPRDGWGAGTPVQTAARDAAVGAASTIDHAEVFPDLASALADCTRALATTARPRDQSKPVIGPDGLAAERDRARRGEQLAFVFGPERTGLTNDEVAGCEAILTLPVHPALPSLNLAQAVGLVAYEWWKAQTGGGASFPPNPHDVPASKGEVEAFLRQLEAELEQAGYFLPAGKRPVMWRNLVNIFRRVPLTTADVRTLHGMVVALARGRVARHAQAELPSPAKNGS